MAEEVDMDPLRVNDAVSPEDCVPPHEKFAGRDVTLDYEIILLFFLAMPRTRKYRKLCSAAETGKENVVLNLK